MNTGRIPMATMEELQENIDKMPTGKLLSDEDVKRMLLHINKLRADANGIYHNSAIDINQRTNKR